ncbi:cytochrome P450 [Rhodocollybia butyracea]|uniref:Cytochrome P450 n=1 Tax=Rhodocollybia butyracea TaxID=206335 RepID=A0A9P5PI64_9AGAR|nr:cytochrome P450 [Rhodocollybia butyracea]
MLSVEPIHALALLFFTSILVLCARWKDSRQYPLPPGPKKLPILGTCLISPEKVLFGLITSRCVGNTVIIFITIGDSDIIHLSALGNSIIVLDSAQAISDLLEKRSLLYSSRPNSVMLNELIGWGITLGTRPNDDIWKAQRRILTNAIPPTEVKRFHTKQITATHELLRALAHSDDIMGDLYTWTTVLIMDITYGIQGEEALPFIKTAIEAIKSLDVAATPGAFLVDQFPILKYVAGTATSSLASVALEQIEPTKDIAQQEELIKAASAMAHFLEVLMRTANKIKAMLMNPDIQTEAQRELDRVLAPGDLPTFSLEPDLPYIHAVVRETPVSKDIGPAFGFGRRACPGKELALASLWIGMASILRCYRIEPEIDEHGNLAERKAEWYPGLSLVNHPLPFKCRFIPRYKDIEASLDVKLT